jgi:hypothetical protein
MIYSLPEDVIENEIPKETPIWFIVASDDDGEFILTPDVEREWALWLFMKQGDAEHFARITEKLAPAYRGRTLKAASEPIGEVLDYVVEKQLQFGVLSPNESLNFFQAYEDYMADYYGMHDS